MRYPGGKGKTYHQIINLLPPHTKYIETHLGGGAVLRHKKPSPESIGIDRDPKVIEHWRQCFPSIASYVEADALEYLTRTNFIGDEVVYCDPPYLPSTRRRSRVYRYDYDKHDHERLLEIVRLLPCKVLVWVSIPTLRRATARMEHAHVPSKNTQRSSVGATLV